MSRHLSLIKKVLIVLCLFLFATPAFAETVTFTKEYTYQASDFDSRHSSRTLALEMVKRLLLEELGTYLVSETEVKNMQLTKDQVRTYSAGIVGAEVIDEKWDGKTFWLKSKVSADPQEVEKALKKLIEDKYKTQELEETRKQAEKLTKENDRLRKELKAGAKSIKRDKKTEAKNIKAYEKTIKGLNAIEWFEKGNSYNRGTQNGKAKDAYTNAISLNPKFIEAYLERSSTYFHDSQLDRALQDIQTAIRINPINLQAYYRLGSYYSLIAHPFFVNGDKDKYFYYQDKIIEAFNKLIKLQPTIAAAYIVRGRAYKEKGDFNKALRDFNKINSGQFHPNPLNAYQDSGDIYFEFGQYAKAIDDYSKAIDTRKGYRGYQMPEHVAYPFSRRGLTHLISKNYQAAIEDFTVVINLTPDDASPYYRRGLAYSKLGNQQQTISDFKIAASLGDKNAQDALLELKEQW